MHDGEVVERGPVAQTLRHPKHPYTRELLAAVPRLGASGASDA
jgi:peptide/nickel transport system ATP-binding protein